MSSEIGKMLSRSRDIYAQKSNKLLNIVTSILIVASIAIGVGAAIGIRYLPTIPDSPVAILLAPLVLTLVISPFILFAIIWNLTSRLVYSSPLGQDALEDRKYFFEDLNTYTQNTYGISIPDSAQEEILRHKEFQATVRDGIVANLSFRTTADGSWKLFSGNKELQRVS